MKRKIKLIISAFAILCSVFIGGQGAFAFEGIDPKAEVTEDPKPFTFSSEESRVGTASDNCRTFLGMNSWDCGLSDKSWEEENIKGAILTIIMNVSHDFTIIAAYLVLGFIIYGGYRYMFSGGDAGHIVAGKKTLFHSFLGLGIIIMANVIFNAIRFGLLSGSTATTQSVGGVDVTLGDSDPGKLFASSFSWIVGIAGVVAVIFIVYGAILYITSSGDSNKLKRAKDTIIYAAIGLIIVGLAEAISSFVTSKLQEAKTQGQPTSAIVKVISLEEINHEENC